MKKNAVAGILFFCFVLCSCVTQKTESSNKESNAYEATGKIVIPFEISRKAHQILPIIKINYKGSDCRFAVDTGQNVCVFGKQGAKKRLGSEDVPFDQAYEYVKKQFPQQSDSLLRKEAEQIVDNGGITCNLSMFDYFSETFFNGTEFKYIPSFASDRLKVDGIVGINFFNSFDNVLIDYKNNVIEIDAVLLDAEPLPMRKLQGLDLYVTEVKLDGYEQTALIDTGAEYLFIRSDYKNKKNISDSEITDCVLNKKNSRRKLNFGSKKVLLSVGNIDISFNGYSTANMFMNCSKEAIALGQVCNILGYEVFKNRRLQL